MILSTIESKSRKAFQKLISTSIAVVVITFLLLGLPGLTSPAHAGPGGTGIEGWVTRFNVSDGAASAYWYEEKLDMLMNKESSAFPYYVQLFYPEYPDTQIGLSQSDPVESGKATATIVVSDIIPARDYLEFKGVDVAPICDAGDGSTVLAFFCDPDGNNLALRENNFPFKIKLPDCGPPICNSPY